MDGSRERLVECFMCQACGRFDVVFGTCAFSSVSTCLHSPFQVVGLGLFRVSTMIATLRYDVFLPLSTIVLTQLTRKIS